MGAIKVIKSDDGKPYISLEDLTNELVAFKNTMYMDDDNPPELLDLILHTLNAMEQEYYTKVLTHTGNIDPQSNAETEADPAETEKVIDDPETALVNELLQNLKIPKRKLNREQSEIADDINGIYGANSTVSEGGTPEELDNYKTKMGDIRTICSRANLKYEHWIMLVEAFQKNVMTKKELFEMVQQRITNGQSKNRKSKKNKLL
jgi:hypothetical protein